METLRIIRSVRAVRWYRPLPIDAADLAAILEAGRRTGSGKNRQPWHLIVVRSRERLAHLATCGLWTEHLGRAALGIFIIVPRDFGLVGLPADHYMPDTERVVSLMAIFDAGRLAQNLVLAAWARGIGSCPATMHDQARARGVLGVPEDQWIAMGLAFGYPAEETSEQHDYVTSIIVGRGRRPLDDVVHYEQWQAKGDSEGQNLPS